MLQYLYHVHGGIGKILIDVAGDEYVDYHGVRIYDFRKTNIWPNPNNLFYNCLWVVGGRWWVVGAGWWVGDGGGGG
ncbi:MAG: hypothetical protein ACKPAD_15140, partial [Bacteroidota bacterium]